MEGRGLWVVEGSNGPTATRNSLVAVGNKALRQGPCGEKGGPAQAAAKQCWDKCSLEWPGLGSAQPVSNHGLLPTHMSRTVRYVSAPQTSSTHLQDALEKKHVDRLSMRRRGVPMSSHSVSR